MTMRTSKEELARRREQLSPEKQALLARRLRGESAGPAPLASIPRRATPGPVVLSFAQQRIWFLSQLTPGNPVYNVPTAVRMTGTLDVAVLERCFAELVQRHEAVRTVFTTIDEVPMQLVRAAAPVTLGRIDLSALPAAAREQQALQLAADEACQPFDLAAGLLLRATLLQLAA